MITPALTLAGVTSSAAPVPIGAGGFVYVWSRLNSMT